MASQVRTIILASGNSRLMRMMESVDGRLSSMRSMKTTKGMSWSRSSAHLSMAAFTEEKDWRTSPRRPMTRETTLRRARVKP
ncbi:hypothetical protein AWY79_00930 [Pseudodesulfovibrio indicus]|uniref:Uncharacterized protein n=1 Tax=Pseudodesulfovibrio indicus TaxID=1716143 RepID=A0ABM7DMD2_9BACT|nr:hypothetical protein AWY79_00930 [Pseudodesulfovibrio indicus]